LKFARKTKEQYVISEDDGKPSGWRADYVNGKWLVDEKIKAPRKAKAKPKAKAKSKAASRK
jgi:DNA topoisomerase-1